MIKLFKVCFFFAVRLANPPARFLSLALFPTAKIQAAGKLRLFIELSRTISANFVISDAYYRTLYDYGLRDFFTPSTL